MDSIEETTVEQSLCLSCGLCCDGTLFDFAPIKPDDDLTALLSFKNIIDKRNSETVFELPCAAHQNKCCQIYKLPRPAICGAYRCALLRKHEKGEISFAEALEKINRAFALRELYRKELARVLPESEKMPVLQSKKLLPETEAMLADSVLLKKWSAVTMCLSMLLDCLRTDFNTRAKKD